MITEEQKKKLQEKLPDWALKAHPTKTFLSVIHPMAVIDRLNDVFGIGNWQFTTEYITCNAFKTSNGKDSFMSAVKGRLTIPEYDIVLEQYGGSTNEDMGDALKGGGTDALTKIASYLGIGAEVYKGNGNIAGGSKEQIKKENTVINTGTSISPEEAFEKAKLAIENAETLDGLDVIELQIKASKNIPNETTTIGKKLRGELRTLINTKSQDLIAKGEVPFE